MILKKVKELRLTAASLPLVLLAICLATYGTLVPYLGFYQDDWQQIYYGFGRGLNSLHELFLYDSRPFAAYLYIAGFKLLGFDPLGWQFFSLLLRSLTVIVTWFYLRTLWPRYQRQTAWAALLFAVYPVFNLQALSVAYNVHWMGYLLYAFSIWCMLLAIRHPRRFWLFTGLSVLSAGLELALVEYFAGIELIRPALLWLLAGERSETGHERLQKVAVWWLPYLGILFAFAIYRMVLLPMPGPGFGLSASLTIFGQLISAPLATGVKLIQYLLQDTTNVLLTTWTRVINPQIFAIRDGTTLKILAVSGLAGLVLLGYFTFVEVPDESTPEKPGSVSWSIPAFWIGLLITILGMLPAWAIDRSLIDANPMWSGRYALGSMLGASLVIVALAEAMIRNRKGRTIFLSALLGLTIGWQVSNLNSYRWAWAKQIRFYQQLDWRAPYIQPGTAFLADGEFLPYMGDYPVSFAISTLYSQGEDTQSIAYWFFDLPKRFEDKRQDLVQGITLSDHQFSASFSGDSRDSLVIDFNPEQGQCLWVLSAKDADIRSLSDITREVLPASNLSRIQLEAPARTPFPEQIFGSNAPQGWCYYFEKADLARQYQDWPQVATLWDEASQAGYQPASGIEYLPFIEGMARKGDWKTAEKLTYKADNITQGMATALCSLWGRLGADGIQDAQGQASRENVNSRLGCPP